MTRRSLGARAVHAYDRVRSGAAAQRLSSGVAGQAVRRTRSLDLTTHALAFGAQQLLCTVPLIVAISAVVSHAPGRGVSYATITLFGLDGSSAIAVAQLLGLHSSSISVTTLVVSMIIALVFTTSVGAVQQGAFELIWTLPRISGVRAYVRQLVWAPTLALFTIGVLAAARPGRWLDEHVSGAGDWLVVLIRVARIVAFYWWPQYWLLDRRVPALPLLPGAVAVGVLTMVLVEASQIVLPGQISWQVQAYGLVGVGLVFAAWLMILSVLIFVGVLFVRCTCRRGTAQQSGGRLRIRVESNWRVTPTSRVIRDLAAGPADLGQALSQPQRPPTLCTHPERSAEVRRVRERFGKVPGMADHAGQTLPVQCSTYLTMEDVMARSDLVIDLVEAQRRGNGARLRVLVEAIAAEERSNQHHLGGGGQGGNSQDRERTTWPATKASGAATTRLPP